VALLGAEKFKYVLVAMTGALLACDSKPDSVKSPAVPHDSREKPPATPPARAADATAGAKFDFYLLSMTAHAAFCADGHAGKRECRAHDQRPLVIHGLWPENLEPRTYPRDCPVPKLSLDPMLEQQLRELMPGMEEGLHEHEWREHGGCSGLDDDEYFQRTLELARPIDAALGARLTTLAGRETSAGELREIAELFRPGIGPTLTFHCRNLRGRDNVPVLFEVRQCVDNDGPGGAPGTLLECASVKRRDQGCGASFRVAERER
jgi:ribonuclease T2